MAACLTEICHRILYNFWSVFLVRYLIALWGLDNAYETDEIKSVQELKAVHVLCMKHIVLLETCLLIGRCHQPNFSHAVSHSFPLHCQVQGQGLWPPNEIKGTQSQACLPLFAKTVHATHQKDYYTCKRIKSFTVLKQLLTVVEQKICILRSGQLLVMENNKKYT